jgi:hypothetical protein
MSTNQVLERIEEFGDAVMDMRKNSDKQFAELKDRLEVLESVGQRPRGAAEGTADEREHKAKFLDWVRRPRDHQTKNILGEAQAEMEKKSVLIGSDPDGGYAVPKLIAANIERRVTTQNPFRQLVDVVTVGSSDFNKLISKNQAYLRLGRRVRHAQRDGNQPSCPRQADLRHPLRLSESLRGGDGGCVLRCGSVARAGGGRWLCSGRGARDLVGQRQQQTKRAEEHHAHLGRRRRFARTRSDGAGVRRDRIFADHLGAEWR